MQMILYLLQKNKKQKILGFQNTLGLYCHELNFFKCVNCKNPNVRMKVRTKSEDEIYRRATRNFLGQGRFLGIETKRKAHRKNVRVFFLKNNLKTAF